MPILDKLQTTLLGLYLFFDTASGASSTVNTVVAAGATSVVIAGASTFANGQDFRLGTGETMERCRVLSGGGTTTLTLTKALKFDHAVGEQVVQQSHINIGVPEADGFKLNWAGETSDIYSAITRLAYATVTGFVDITATWRFPAITTDIIAFALGIPRANVVGNNTAAAQTGTVGPRLFTTDGLLFGAVTNVNCTAAFQMQDATYAHIDLYNLTFDPTAMNVTFSRGQPSFVPVRVMASSGAIDFTGTIYTPFTVDSANASSKDDVFAEITAVQTVTDTGTSTTLTSGVAAGVYTLPVASVTNITGGTWLKVGAGDQIEYHLTHGVVTLNVNLRTQVLRAFANATPVVVQALSALQGIVGGFTFGISGQVTTQRAETIRTSLGFRVTNATATLSGFLNSITALNFMTAMQQPSSALVANVMTLGTKISTGPSTTMLFTGVTADGNKVSIMGWQGSAVINGESAFSQAVETRIPFSFKPNGLQVFTNV